MKTPTGICPELVHALQSSLQWEGDNETLRTAMDGIDLLAVDPANETLMVMRTVSAEVRNGRPLITMICRRVVTGNEYRDWQQSGNVPLIAEDAGSSPAVGSNSHNIADQEREQKTL
jgi:hypothetical protein